MINQRFPTWTFISGLILILGAAWIWISAEDSGGMPTRQLQAAHQGFQAPDFELPSIPQTTQRLSDLKGKVILINYWASWCPPCRAEMPALKKVYQDYAQEGFIVLAINSTSQDSRQAAIKFTSEIGTTFPILFDEKGYVSNLYQVSALPTSFFINRDGIIQEVIIGGPMTEALLRTRIERLVKEK